jgi:kumamolisin
MALVNQGRGTPLTDGHQAVYGLAGTQARFNPSGCYRDITQGNDGGFTAGLGYDLVTGLGVPIANKIIPALRGNGGMPAILLLLMDN